MAGAAKSFTTGTHRVVDPETTLARWAPEMHRFGITRLADLTDLDVIGIPVVQAVRPNGKSMSVAQGKGATLAAASVSALMEASETWHAENLPAGRVAAARDLGRDAVDAARLPRRTSAPFDVDCTREWCRGSDLVSGAARWVPRDAIDLDTTTATSGPFEFATSSVGLSSGNVIEEAIAHGLYEVVERDAWALAEQRVEQGERRIALSTIDDPNLCRLLDRLTRAGVTCVLFDATSDIGLACVAAVIFDEHVNPFRRQPMSFGLGCHPSPAVAASRAITEAAQSRLTIIAGTRDDLTRADYGAKRDSADHDRIRSHLRACPAAVPFTSLPDRTTASVAGDLDVAVSRVVAAGMDEVVAVDLTRPEIGLPVVKVVVPGMEDWETGAVRGARFARHVP